MISAVCAGEQTTCSATAVDVGEADILKMRA